MTRAWRRTLSESEIDQKMTMFAEIRGECDDFQEAMVEVLSTVLASPKFLYLVRASQSEDNHQQILLFLSTLDHQKSIHHKRILPSLLAYS